MATPSITFRDLVAPVTPETFLADYHRKRFLHAPGDAARAGRVMDWETFSGLLDMTALWSAESMKLVLDGRNLLADEYCRPGRNRDGGRVNAVDPERVAELMGDGATVVLDLIETLTPGLRATTAALEMATGAMISCNAYCSRKAHAAFPAHFDTMDVYALHIAGEKTWRIYEGCFEHPIQQSGYDYPSFPQEHHDEAKGALAAEITLTPGDLLYIPRGLYHEALASSDACLHLSFGTTEATGLDLLRNVLGDLAALPAFRAALPHFDSTDAHDAHVRDLADHLRDILADPHAAAEMRDDQRRRAVANLAGFNLPAPELGPRFRVVGDPATLAGNIELGEWIGHRDHFTWPELVDAFNTRGEERLAEDIETLSIAGIVEPV